MGRLTFVWDLWLGGLCTCIQGIDPEFHPRHKSVLSFSFSLNSLFVLIVLCFSAFLVSFTPTCTPNFLWCRENLSIPGVVWWSRWLLINISKNHSLSFRPSMIQNTNINLWAPSRLRCSWAPDTVVTWRWLGCMSYLDECTPTKAVDLFSLFGYLAVTCSSTLSA